MTILVVPLMSCSARLPVYALLIGAFFQPEHGGLVLLSLYLIGIVVAILVAKLFRATLLRGSSAPFVMELPPYRVPTLRTLLTHMWERAWLYVQKAGTTILAMSLLVWALSSFPKPPPESPLSPLEYSITGRAGKTLEPVMKPCGFDWRMTVALLAGLAAKEVVVSSLGTIYGVEEGQDSHAPLLREALRRDPSFSPLVAYGFMVFTLLYIPCVSTVAVVARETGSWRWALLLIAYTTLLAWTLATLIHQLGSLALGAR